MNYDDIRKYNTDRACVERDGKFGYIDRDTEEVIPLIYDAAKDFSDGVALVCREGKWGCIDVYGNEVCTEAELTFYCFSKEKAEKEFFFGGCPTEE